MRSLTVLYDSDCGLCQRVKGWLEAQPKYVEMEFVAAGSMAARQRFPGLDPEDTLQEVTVVGDGGEVYRGAKAWLICLWALRRYRLMALDWSTPERMALAKRFVAWVSRNRTTQSTEAFGGEPLRPIFFFLAPAFAFPISFFVGSIELHLTGGSSDLLEFSLELTLWAYALTFLVGLPVIVALRHHGLFRPRPMILAGIIVALLPFLLWGQPVGWMAALASGSMIGYVIWRAHTPYGDGSDLI